MQQPNVKMESQIIQNNRNKVPQTPVPFVSTEVSLSTQLGLLADSERDVQSPNFGSFAPYSDICSLHVGGLIRSFVVVLRSFHHLYVWQCPRTVVIGLERAVETKECKPRSTGHGLDPILLMAFR
jgi:hypothetical protein